MYEGGRNPPPRSDRVMVDFGNLSSPDSFKNDAFVYFLFRPTRVTFQRIFSLESKTNVLSPQALFVKAIRPYNRQFVKKQCPIRP